jgi:hypothetical protein
MKKKNVQYTSLRQLEVYTSNPFISEIGQKITVNQRRKSKGDLAEVVLLSTNTGEINGSLSVIKVENYEKEQFVKVFVKNLELFFSLNQPATRVLMYIFYRLEAGKDYILFDMEEALKYTKYSSKNSVTQGLSCLIESKLLARSKKNYLYYINPLVFFNGDRVNFVKQIRMKEKKYRDENQLTLPLENTKLLSDTNDDSRSENN